MSVKTWFALAVVTATAVSGVLVGKAVADTVDPYAPTRTTVVTSAPPVTSVRPPVRDPVRPPARSPFVP